MREFSTEMDCFYGQRIVTANGYSRDYTGLDIEVIAEECGVLEPYLQGHL